MKKYLIERHLPDIGSATPQDLCLAARRSNDALARLGKEVQWIESYVTPHATFCIYLAESEEWIQRHAELSGFPATRVVPVECGIDPTTGSLG